MSEKAEAMDNIEAICSVPGVDMVQFGPSDYSMSRGWNSSEHVQEFKAAEREMIKEYLGDPSDQVQSPTPAQRLVFGDTRRRIPEMFNLDYPAMLGVVQNQDSYAQGVAAQRPFYFDHIAELTAKTAAVREARILMGRAFAARVWQELDMPAAHDMRVPLSSVPPLLEDEAFSILVDLLSAPDGDGVIIGDQVARAVELKRSDLIEPLGLKLVWRIAGRPCRDGALFVANGAPAIACAFAGTSRETDAAQRLRDIPGASAGHARIGAIGFNGRGTVVPADQLARALEVITGRAPEAEEVA